MNKRYIQVTLKDTGKVRIFPTIVKMYAKLGESAVGVTRNSLWNALSKQEGKYENKKVKIEYKETAYRVWK